MILRVGDRGGEHLFVDECHTLGFCFSEVLDVEFSNMAPTVVDKSGSKTDFDAANLNGEDLNKPEQPK